MNIENIYSKLIGILNIKHEQHNEICDILTATDTYTQTKISNVEKFLCPTEANFQLPNVFLRTKKIAECEQLVGDRTHVDIEKWNECLNELEKICEFEFEEPEFIESSENDLYDEEFIERNIKQRS
ncbi:DUF5100 domain-containing protein [Hamiltosporidium tvaerminnensis]|uniref:DUF5100 domain-containing protein n=2 Tax=Hamiltosporidium TaxID=1176354 RepID=A0A4Q9M607_9MICR|nr:hypothetical protein LUQ84_001856 [Hamiltosporidium tvaerminnensis]TBU04848.1 DUF5100 domain-containing protein [Hamiltosporidium tvaerminnensis]TBU08739.1 DUF5100 domain-containing protein [Hamiltosporidium magnivora]TBU21041.1 DUF5100 domain-containing protein [Hamiltosporidium tvaerminnensis]